MEFNFSFDGSEFAWDVVMGMVCFTFGYVVRAILYPQRGER